MEQQPSNSQPLPSSYTPTSIARHDSHLSVHSTSAPRGVSKNTATIPRARSVSSHNSAKLYDLLSGQVRDDIDSTSPSRSLHSWSTPQPSPESASFIQQSAFKDPIWSVPTPPCSDSGVSSSLSAHSSHEAYPSTPALTRECVVTIDPPTTSAEMSTLSYMLPSHYGSMGVDLPSYQPSGYAYRSTYSQPYGNQQSSSNVSQPPAMSMDMSYTPMSHRSNGPLPSLLPTLEHYNTEALYTTAPLQSGLGRSISNPTTLPSQSHEPHASSYTPSFESSPSLFDATFYSASAQAPRSYHTHTQSPASYAYPPTVMSSASPQPTQRSHRTPNIISSATTSMRHQMRQRPKPQCWEHGCNGREFSTFSNLLRHQREKSGSASKSFCPKCGAEFTRTTARNGHLAHEKCTKRRRSVDSVCQDIAELP